MARPYDQEAMMPYSYTGVYPLPIRISPNGLGAIQQFMPAVNGGGAFQFGYNTGYFRGELYKPEEIGQRLESETELGYNIRSYAVAGMLNPYLTIEGNSNSYYDNAADLGQAIYNQLVAWGYPIDYSSIQFRVEAYVPPGQTGPAPPPTMVGTPYPTTPANPSVPTAASGGCSLSAQGFPNWLACQLGVTPTTAMVVGAIGALIAVVAITKR